MDREGIEIFEIQKERKHESKLETGFDSRAQVAGRELPIVHYKYYS